MRADAPQSGSDQDSKNSPQRQEPDEHHDEHGGTHSITLARRPPAIFPLRSLAAPEDTRTMIGATSRAAQATTLDP